MAAAMSTADGLILAIANALSHDLYYKIIDPKAETAKRLIVARVLLVIIGFAGATIAALEIQGILGSVIWAFDFAMSGCSSHSYLVYGGRELMLKEQLQNATRINIRISILSLGKNRWSWILRNYSLTFGIVGASVSLVSMVIVKFNY